METTQENQASAKGFAGVDMIVIMAILMACMVGMIAIGALMVKDEAQARETSAGISESLRASDRFTQAVGLAPAYGALVARAREEIGVSEDSLAILLKISILDLRQIEAGRRPMTQEQMQRACEILDMDPDLFAALSEGNLVLPTDKDIRKLMQEEQEESGGAYISN